jgi:hypothetical protein
MSVKIYGFTLLRNGVKYDYSFRECLKSLAPICQSVYLALGESDDGTEEAVADLDFLKITPTVWDDSLREGGLILSQQTNVALEALRSEKRTEPESWGFYLQCDEVIHELDYELLKSDFQKAEDQGCDAISFRYFHFWQDHHNVAINKKWYPQEIRAVKVDSDAESWGDAQSFKNVKKVYQSEARIYHYGHVREDDKYLEKKADILKFYHSDEKMAKYKRREKRFDDMTETLLYLGRHPLLMKERIERLGDHFDADKSGLVYILGDKSKFPEDINDKISASQIIWCDSLFEVPIAQRKHAILLKSNWFQRLMYRSKVPTQMRSKLALPWSDETYLTFKLSEKGVAYLG